MDLDLLAKERGQMKRVEGVLSLVVIFKLNETVALGRFRVEIERYNDLDNVAEPTELVLQIFLGHILGYIANAKGRCVFRLVWEHFVVVVLFN